MNITEFTNQYYPTASVPVKRELERWLTWIESLMDGEESAQALRNSEFLCKTFFLRQSNGVSASHYHKIKQYLQALFDYYGIVSHVPSQQEVVESQKIVFLFRDLNSVIDFIDKIGENKIQGYDKRFDLAFIKAIAVLAWHGFAIKDLIILKKEDIIKQDAPLGHFIKKNNGSHIELNESEYTQLHNLMICSSYKSLPNGKLQNYYGDNRFLFRPTISNLDVLDEINIAKTIRRFNEKAYSYRVAINIKKLNRCAIYEKILQDSSEDSLINKITKHMGCHLSIAYGYKAEYEQWKEKFYPEIPDKSSGPS